VLFTVLPWPTTCDGLSREGSSLAGVRNRGDIWRRMAQQASSAAGQLTFFCIFECVI